MIKSLFSAKTATFTSDGFSTENLANVSVQFTAANISSGNGVCTIDVSNDGVNWVTGVAFVDYAATAHGTYKTSQTLSSNASVIAFLGSDFGAKMIRAKVTVTTDGSYSAVVFGNKIES